jgi:hypothetical protein
MHSGRDLGGDWCRNAAVGEQAAIMFHRPHKAWKRAARADRQFHRAFREDVGRAGIQISCHNCRGNRKPFQSLGVKPLLHKLADAILPSFLSSRVRVMEAEKIAKANAPAKVAQVARGNAVGVSGAEQATDACAYDGGDGNLLLFKYFEDAQVRKPTREAAAQGNCDPRSRVPSRESAQSRLSAWAATGVWLGGARIRHAASLAGGQGASNKTEVLDFRYLST